MAAQWLLLTLMAFTASHVFAETFYNEGPKIEVADKVLYITHDSRTLIDLKTFPKLNILQEIRFVEIQNCEIGNSYGFGDLFEHFGMNGSIKAFQGVNIGKSLDGRFSKGFEKVENLTLKNNNIRKLREFVFQKLPKLRVLDLSSNEIDEVHENAFKYLSELEKLYLNKNKIKSLPDGMFENQKQLRQLHLNYNKLKTLSIETFRGLDSLNVLHLVRNSISNMADDIFHNIPKLRVISLGYGQLVIPYKFFERNNQLESVLLRKVLMPDGLHLSDVDELLIESSELKNISGLSNITKISITGSKLAPIPVKTFNNLRGLKSLDLSSNQLVSLDDGLFDGLTELESLQLSWNNLTNITGQIFRDLHNLTEINISNNRIVLIARNAFTNLTHLKTVNLENNYLSSIDNGLPFMHLNKLKTLKLNNNVLTRVPSDLMEMKELRTIDLGFNKIETIKFSELQKNNMKVSFTHENCAESEIATYLNDNPLNCDCDMDKFLTGTNQLPGVFSHNCPNHVYYLEPCYLESYSRDDCPEHCSCTQIENGPGLQIFISCEGKGLTGFPEIKIQNATSISIDVSDNNLRELPDLSNMSLVTFIKASHNQISEIGNLPPQLRGLDVSHNQIKTIDTDVFHHLLEVIFLKRNPFQCHCSSENTNKFIEFAIKRRSMLDLQGEKCNSFQELSMEALSAHCTTKSIILILVITTILSLTCGTFGVLFYRHKQFIKMWLYTHGLFSWWVDEDHVDKDKVYDAFISYSQLDDKFVYNVVDELEKGSPPFKICIHERDFLGGQEIVRSIIEAVEKSRRTVIILSKNFLKSKWATHEFNCAIQLSIADKRNRLIVVKYGDIGDISQLDTTIRSYIATHTYIESNDRWFSEKIRYAMPHKRRT